MAELLMMVRNQTHPDPDKDIQLFKIGHIVATEDDGFVWGTRESIERWVEVGNDPDDFPGDHAVIKIPGVPKADVLYLIEKLTDGLDTDFDIVRKRAWKCNIGMLPVPIRNQILKNFVYTTTSAQWNAIIEYTGI